MIPKHILKDQEQCLQDTSQPLLPHAFKEQIKDNRFPLSTAPS